MVKPGVKLVSALNIKKYFRKGYPMYLCHVVDTSTQENRVYEILIVAEYTDLFPEEVPGLPPRRVIDFTIDLEPRIAPISKAPYRMASAEMKELKSQLEELLDKGFICPSVSPWGAPVLFVKKKDGCF